MKTSLKIVKDDRVDNKWNVIKTYDFSNSQNPCADGIPPTVIHSCSTKKEAEGLLLLERLSM